MLYYRWFVKKDERPLDDIDAREQDMIEADDSIHLASLVRLRLDGGGMAPAPGSDIPSKLSLSFAYIRSNGGSAALRCCTPADGRLKI